MDDRIGSVGQVKGVMLALDSDKYKIVEKKIAYNKWGKLPNCLKGATLIGTTPETKKELDHKAPDMVISASRRTASAARWIKRKSGGKTKIVQIMHPGNCGLKDFDLVFVSKHDAHKKSLPNFRFMVGNIHRINEKSVKEAQELWKKEFAKLPRPWTAVIIGGAIKGRGFSIENAENLGEAIKDFKKKTGGSILITTSRRTGRDGEKAIMDRIKDTPQHSYLWGDKGVNPYMGYLACCDNAIVTGDSVSMVSEACGTGRPVFVFSGKDWLTHKHERFLQSLYDDGYAIELGKDVDFKPRTRLDPGAFVAEQVETLWS